MCVCVCVCVIPLLLFQSAGQPLLQHCVCVRVTVCVCVKLKVRGHWESHSETKTFCPNKFVALVEWNYLHLLKYCTQYKFEELVLQIRDGRSKRFP